MPSRREFLQAGLAASVVSVVMPIREAAGASPRSAAAPPGRHPLHCVVCDMRSPWSTDFAREAERLGIKVVRTNGDITDFWFHDLSLRWKEAPVAIGGLTAPGALFCLERLGWDHGLRVVFRGTHRLVDTSRAEHAMSGPSSTIAAAQRRGLGGAEWACHVARLVSSCAVERETSSAPLRGVLAGSEAVEHDRLISEEDALTSWVIAPKRA
ncbi:MAG: hypothetical protein HY657_15705 [Acidobacteria bacterium]|nr:hypothetical protein [Acidobacteriota bacterium]